MKLNKLSIPLSMTAALVGVVTCAVSCAKKSSAPEKMPATPPHPAVSNAVMDNTGSGMPTNSLTAATTPVVTNIPPAAPQEITNPPPAETTTKAGQIAANTETNLLGHDTVVEMPTNTPTAPTNFYPTSMTASGVTMSPVGGETGSTNAFLTFGIGYEHIYHGDNNDSLMLDAKFYLYNDGLRDAVGKNAWLIPDMDAEVFSGDIPKPDYHPNSGSDNGLRFRADFTWPWVHWTSLMLARNSVCPFCEPLTLGLGPTANFGFDHLYNESDYRFARYAGLRLTFNRSGFIEYTVGDTDGLAGTRQQIVTELPFYVSHDGAVRYYVRGLWNHGLSSKPDELEGGIFLEMPLGLFISPDKWGDLVPFAQ